MNHHTSSLIRLAHACTIPKEYFAGRSPDAPILPQNIISFCHTSAQVLMNSNHRRGHQHHRFTLICALSGEGRMGVDGEVLTFKPGDAYVILPFQLHRYLHFETNKIDWLIITFETGDITSSETLRGRSPAALGGEGRSILKSFLISWLNKRQEGNLALYLALLIHHLRQSYEATRTTRPSFLGKTDREFLQSANALAATEGLLSVSQIASQLGISHSLLRVRFATLTGLTIGKHLRNIRIERACSLLYQGHLTVSEVAETCGFTSVYAFSRAFKTARGISPRQYQKSIQA